ncbi:MAG: pyruvate, phosphate dikinase [Bacteroidia bacterium]|nr:MAG: pyruvate, phosphate dikinase [Bacteroidia bacterium]
MEKKRVYVFGAGKTEGKGSMRNELGGKGANLAEMSLLGMPVPPGFTITTDTCNDYFKLGKEQIVAELKSSVLSAVGQMEEAMGAKFGDRDNPLLVSVRSGARASMPGMMDTILNLGLNDEAVEGLAKRTDNPRFAWDSYRRFVQMYGDVVLGMKPESKEDNDPFEEIIDALKAKRGIESDTDFTVDDLKLLVEQFKAAVLKATGKSFPVAAEEQLWGAVMAVFDSWMNDRAKLYRRLNKIPEEWGTAVNVQCMVFGNMGDNSATGVAFTRDAATGERLFNGEFLINAQGEDVVAGIRTPQPINIEGSRRWAKLKGISEEERKRVSPSLEEVMPAAYKELDAIQQKLESHYRDMQDIEFTIQDGKVWMLQTRSGKRTGVAMVKMAMDMLDEGMIDEKTAVLRVEPQKLDELLHPIFDREAIKGAKVIASGLPASPGAATGRIVFFADEAEEWAGRGEEVILVRVETSPEDLRGMNVANGILTARGGMTSHAAVVARGMGKCCVSGVATIEIDNGKRQMRTQSGVLKEGDWISLDGSTGRVFEGKIETEMPDMSGDFARLMDLAEKYSTMKVRTNADTPHDSQVAIDFGAKGIGLCRTEHMFFEGERILAMREMILAESKAGREAALAKLLPMQRQDFVGIFEAMKGFPVNVRLLDPPLHEFLPKTPAQQEEMAQEMGVSVEAIAQQVEGMGEVNPMLGFRGCRLGVFYPEITRMQARAIIEAAVEVSRKGVEVHPEIMIPLVGHVNEFKNQRAVVVEVAEQVFKEQGVRVDYKVGTMIEIPRAALTAHEIAEQADFFSFGTNDLTQMTFGYSRDDIGRFLPYYLNEGILKFDPFKTMDREGVYTLVEMASKKGRAANSKLHVGICGEHGGDPTSVGYCHGLGFDYVSCSPYRVPIARLAAAHAALSE